jgi:chlorobactene glucosyltransferase
LIILLSSIIALLAVVLLVTTFNAITAPMLKRAPKLQNTPRVSVLVPARDEEKNIGACLEGLLKQDYPNLEILVLDDDSNDRTVEKVRQFAAKDLRVRFFTGKPLPTSWLGKNWACHQLSEQATGEIFIFTDADNRYAPPAVAHTVGWMQKYRLSLLSAFCHQITKTLPEKLAVPAVNMLVYSYLPLWLTYYSRASSLAAANGQWLAFTREAYKRIGGHRAVCRQVVEDVELSRRAKQMGEKILVLSAKDEVYSRMYQSARQVWDGYSKNLFGLMRFQTLPFFIILSLLFLIHIAPFLLVWFESLTALALIAIGMNLVIRGILAAKYAQPWLIGALLHPVAIAYLILLGLNSYRWYRTGQIKWKGRLVEMRSA